MGMMKKILITGNSGYIGSHLSKMLADSYEVYGLDINLPQTDCLKDWYNIDIRKLFTIDQEFDAVIHLAALVNVGESEQQPISYYITNLNGTMNVINKIKTKNFIFASTGAAAGCESAYGISKRAAEDVVREYCTIHNPKDYTIFRFYNVIGSDGFAPTNPDGLMYNLMKSKEKGEFTIFGNDYDTRDGTCIRDYVHVNEICDALRSAIEKPSNQIECLGHGVGYTVAELVNKFREVNNIPNINLLTKIGPRRKGDLAVSVLDNVSPFMKKLYTLEQLLKV
jgi:UDP-glucose 4-epimerase